MGRMDYLAMKTDPTTSELINSDLKELGNAAKKLATHAVKLGGLGFGTTFLKWVASFAAIYLLVLDRTNWRTNMLTSLLIPYIFFSLPSVLFNLLSGEVGKWIAFIAVVLRLFFPRRFPGVGGVSRNDNGLFIRGFAEHVGFNHAYVAEALAVRLDWLEMPGSLILLLVVAPSFFADTLRSSWVGIVICLGIGCYLLQEHIRASGGFRNSFTRTHGISNTLGIIILLVYPVWALVLHFI
ncbi:cold-regulated 413 plasma membrane protein 2 isoform X1 [Macadamia integrifolia]|uniref:cold-regulated 413 plasma membrane protein 2 isoform X1 n=1 Tax=Macadamia integrifolia TaxID=60698 RepID=UPI001C4FDD79|nr:cold-regulated 413 plasma membrane protein 2 isoform X1 [Macadamia integrifolia]XP_042492978.1 cold-regulated 413 plasma membrane protein 2 isoform X1 [Macadamia integrifolia]